MTHDAWGAGLRAAAFPRSWPNTPGTPENEPRFLAVTRSLFVTHVPGPFGDPRSYLPRWPAANQPIAASRQKEQERDETSFIPDPHARW